MKTAVCDQFQKWRGCVPYCWNIDGKHEAYC